MFGTGINTVIIGAYEWLVAHYAPGDEIFIFGFSRGAYASRSLAGLIAKYGVLRPGSPVGIGELFDRYRKGASERTIYQLTEARRTGKLDSPTTLERRMLTYSVLAPVKMVGVWDTVGALQGEYGFWRRACGAQSRTASTLWRSTNTASSSRQRSGRRTPTSRHSQAQQRRVP